MISDLKSIELKVKQHLENLLCFTATAGEGITRLPFSLEARKTVSYIRDAMEDIGLDVYEDYAGSIIGKYKGTEVNAPSIIIGSHYDSVKNGGNFDGIAGIVCGLEIARRLKENNIRLKYPLEIMGLNDEEGLRFGTGFFGSKAMLGMVTLDDLLKYKDENNISVYQAMTEYGLKPEKITDMARTADSIKSFIEIHVEQGPILENNKKDVGIVEYIVGMQRYIVEIFGRSDHAGTTPMNMRVDAMEIASKVIANIGDWAREEGNGTVATVGYLKTFPNAINIVPEKVEFSLDVRSKDNKSIETIVKRIREKVEMLCAEHNTKYIITPKLSELPTKLNDDFINELSKICTAKDYNYQKIDSGAGHDSLVMGKHVDTAMVFVPSKEGRSHCKEEWTDYEYLAKAVDVVYSLLLNLNEK
ncbi:M20 family metallo-hydrolase [Clostridium sp. DJ247]|uniref:M20 family metallo-hydrolase n=1 Tax=Clostridium sp. DJ247 TaxID=2726188 RepID=UPI001625A13E|nr:M20 family metallo-hydrolase [Clostridium sp. DJ247]MBC2579762.1 M20 family metallo-hydrolase [Clostridium sp. DJ247]